jgi:hypothetical protein
MGLPETIRVKLTSEEAGAVSVTPVVVQDIPLSELVGLMLDLTGKDPGRIRELLLRGSLVSGASRYRWSGWEADLARLETLLLSLPDPDPAATFIPERCAHVILRGPGLRLDLPRAALERRRFPRRRSLWDVLMEAVAAAGLEYAGYSYRERADQFRLVLSAEASEQLREKADLAGFSTLEAKLRAANLASAEFFVKRVPG